MPSINTGLKGIRSLLEARQPPDISDTISLLDPDWYPFVQLMNALGAIKDTHNPTPRWMEDELAPSVDTLTVATTAATDVTFTVAHANYWLVDDIINIPTTNENVLVTGVNTNNNTITVTRAVGTEPPAAAYAIGTVLLRIGSARAEGDVSRGIVSTLEVEELNYCQIQRDSIGVTNTSEATELYDGADLDYQAAKTMIKQLIDIERMILFGQRNITTGTLAVDGSTQYKRMCGGILEFAQTNRLHVGGTLTEADWDRFAQISFRYGPSKKLVFTSPTITSALSQFAKDKLVTITADERYGFALREWLSPFGTMEIVNHWLLTGDVYGGYAIAIDPQEVMLRVLRGGKGGRLLLRINNIQANDQDARKDEFLTECTLQVNNEKNVSVMTGVEQ